MDTFSLARIYWCGNVLTMKLHEVMQEKLVNWRLASICSECSPRLGHFVSCMETRQNLDYEYEGGTRCTFWLQKVTIFGRFGTFLGIFSNNLWMNYLQRVQLWAMMPIIFFRLGTMKGINSRDSSNAQKNLNGQRSISASTESKGHNRDIIKKEIYRLYLWELLKNVGVGSRWQGTWLPWKMTV